MAADLSEHVLAVVKHDFLSSGERTEAVSVRNHVRAAVLKKFCKIGIVDLTARKHDSRSVKFLGIGLPVLDFFKRLFELVDDEILGTCVRRKAKHVEFVTRDTRILFLPEFSDCRDGSANSVMQFDGFSHSLVGSVNAVNVFEFVQNFKTNLVDVAFKAVFVGFERHIENADEKLVVVHKAQKLEMFDCSVHLAASFARKQCRQKSVPALDASFEQRFCKSANEGAEIVGCDVHRPRARRAQSYADAVVEVEQHFGDVITRVAERKFAVFFDCLLNKLVVGFLQKVFKVKQVFEIPHIFLLFY